MTEEELEQFRERADRARRQGGKKAEDRERQLAQRGPTLDEILKEGDDDAPLGPKATICIALRLQGMSEKEIAKKVELPVETVRQYLFKARKKAKLLDVAPLLDQMAVPMAVDNLIEGIGNGDKDYTLAVLKGRGAFATFGKQESDGAMQLTVKIEHADNGQTSVIDGSVVGVPRAEDGE